MRVSGVMLNANVQVQQGNVRTAQGVLHGLRIFFLTMLRQHSQYDSRLGFSFRVLVRVRLTLILTLKSTLTLTQNPKPNPNQNPKTKP